MRAIFISYRRDDSEGHAGRLFEDLSQAFGEDAVFMDVSGIAAGRDFRKVIEEHTAACQVLLALIGKNWATAVDADGRRRLDDPLDFVRLETASALKRDIPVIPVLVQGARMPKLDQLPEDLKELAYRNNVELTHARWDSDVQVLVQALRLIVQPVEPAASMPVSPPVSAEPAPALPGAVQRPSGERRRRPGLAWAVGLAAFVAVVAAGAGGYHVVQERQRAAAAEVRRVEAERVAEAARRAEAAAQVEQRLRTEQRLRADETAAVKAAEQSRQQAEAQRQAQAKAAEEARRDAEAAARAREARAAEEKRKAAAQRDAIEARAEEQARLAREAAAEQARQEAAQKEAALAREREARERAAEQARLLTAQQVAANQARAEQARLAREAELVRLAREAAADQARPRPSRPPGACIEGYVWRAARPTDRVCVSPAVRSESAAENAQAAERRQPGGGPYGPDTCRQGYVWREAFAGDTVCVAPPSRSRAAADNANAAARVAR